MPDHGYPPLDEPAAIAFAASLVADQYDGKTVGYAIRRATRSARANQPRILYTGIAVNRVQADAINRFQNAFKDALRPKATAGKGIPGLRTDHTEETQDHEATLARKLNNCISRARTAAHKAPRLKIDNRIIRKLNNPATKQSGNSTIFEAANTWSKTT